MDGRTVTTIPPDEPLSPPPISAGYGGPVAGVMSELPKIMARHNRQDAEEEMQRREALAAQLDDFAKDPQYIQHYDLQRRAHQFAMQIHATPWDKKLAKQFQFDDKTGTYPLIDQLHQTLGQRAMRAGKDPTTTPREPATPADPGAPQPQQGQGQSAGAQPDDFGNFPAVPPPPAPGGTHVGPNQVTPNPAVTGVGIPPPPSSPSIDDSPLGNAHYAASIHAASTGMIPATQEMSDALGVPVGTPVAPADVMKQSKAGEDRKLKLLALGLDENGDQLPPEKTPPAILLKREFTKAHEALYDAQRVAALARAEVSKAVAAGTPERIAIARQNAQSAAGRLAVAKQNADSITRKVTQDDALYGLRTGPTNAPNAPNAGGSGGPDDLLNDNNVKTTISGIQYVDLTGYTGKVKSGMKARYEAQGIPALDTKDAAGVKDIQAARMNINSMLTQIEDLLPKDPTDPRRVTNKLSAFFQTDEFLAAQGAWRTTAIKALRAAAGSAGFRMTEAEINLAVEQDIPRISDTVAVAKRKAANMQAQLDNAETSMLTPRLAGKRGSAGNDDYASAGTRVVPPPPVSAAGGRQTIPAATYDDAVKKFGQVKVDAKYIRGN